MERTVFPPRLTTGEFVILTNDPSIRAWGWVAINGKGRVLEFGCIKTETAGKKRRIRKGDEDVHRTEEIVETLLQVIKKYDVQYILSELPHGSQNASAAKMIGICVGIIVGISKSKDIGVEWYSEGDSKKAAYGRVSGDKKEMIDAMEKKYDIEWTRVKYIDEAIADALGVHNAAMKESATLKLMKR